MHLPAPHVDEKNNCRESGSPGITPKGLHLKAQGRAAHPGWLKRNLYPEEVASAPNAVLIQPLWGILVI